MIKEIYDFLVMLDQTGAAYFIFIMTAIYFWGKNGKAQIEIVILKREILKLKAGL